MVRHGTLSSRLVRPFAAVVAIGLAVVLANAVWSLPEPSIRLADEVQRRLPDSGVSNPVTAVLLNFRSYDTLLELGVLVLAMLGAWSLQATLWQRSARGEADLPDSPAVGDVLTVLVQMLTPVIVLVAGYLLWTGSHAPGGAFQAGAVLGAGGVLWIVSGTTHRVPQWAAWLPPLAWVGLLLFLAIGGAMLVAGRRFLEYAPDNAGMLILVIEAASAVSIGVILAVLFAGRLLDQNTDA